MFARRVQAEVTAEGRLVLPEAAALPAGCVELIVLYHSVPASSELDAEAPLHPAFGIWADRPEAADPEAFATALRQATETR